MNSLLKGLGMALASFGSAIVVFSNTLLATEPHSQIAQAVSPYPEEAEALYLSRLEALFSGRSGQNGGFSYDPLEKIPGTDTFKPLEPGADNITIRRDAIDAAETFTGERNSQAFIVWHKGKLIRETYFGGADADTLIVGRSLAKPVTVIAVGRAIAEGYIDSVDQPVSDFITEWQGTDRESMLVRHLLDMRTGFLRQGMEREADSILNRAYLHPYHADIIINEYPLTHKPGERYDYSNATSEMVAPLIERVTGVRYREWVSEQVLRPLGAKGGEVWINRPGGTAHSGCCIMLPADSFMRLGLLSFYDGVWEGKRLLPEGYVAETRTVTPQNPHTGMGLYVTGPYVERRGAANPDLLNLQITLHSEPYLARDLYLYDGNANQVVFIVPSEELVILRVGNAPPRDKPWDNAFLPNTIMRGIIRGPGETAPDPQPRS